MAKRRKKDETSEEVTEAEEPQIDDEETRQRIINALEAKRKAPMGPCVMCGDHDWSVGLFSPIAVSHEASPMGTVSERMYPTATIICRNCGNTHFINLHMLGFASEEAQAGLKYKKPEKPDA